MATNGARRQAKVRLRVVPRGEQVAVKHALAPARDPQGSDHHHHRHHRPRKPSREAIKVNRVVARKSVESEEPDRQRGSSNGGAKGGEGVPQRAASNCGTKGGKPDRQRAASNGGAKGGEPDSQRAASNGDAKGGEDGNSRHDGDHRFQSQNSMSSLHLNDSSPTKSRSTSTAQGVAASNSDKLFSHMRLRAVKALGIHPRFYDGAENGGFYAYCTMVPYFSAQGRPTNVVLDRSSVFIGKEGACEPVWRHDDSQFPIWISDRTFDRLRIEVYRTVNVAANERTSTAAASPPPNSSRRGRTPVPSRATAADVFMGQSTIDLAKCMRSNVGKYTVRFKLKPKHRHRPEEITGDLIVSWRHTMHSERLRNDVFLTDRSSLRKAAANVNSSSSVPMPVHRPHPPPPPSTSSAHAHAHPPTNVQASSQGTNSQSPSTSHMAPPPAIVTTASRRPPHIHRPPLPPTPSVGVAVSSPDAGMSSVETPHAAAGVSSLDSIPLSSKSSRTRPSGRWSSTGDVAHDPQESPPPPPPPPSEPSVSVTHTSTRATATSTHEKPTPVSVSTHAPTSSHPHLYSLPLIQNAPSPSSLKRLRNLKKSQTDPEPSTSSSTHHGGTHLGIGPGSGSGTRASLLGSTSKRFRSLNFNPFTRKGPPHSPQHQHHHPHQHHDGEVDDGSPNKKTPNAQKRPPVSSEIVQFDVSAYSKKKRTSVPNLSSMSRLFGRTRSQKGLSPTDPNRVVPSNDGKLRRMHSDDDIDVRTGGALASHSMHTFGSSTPPPTSSSSKRDKPLPPRGTASAGSTLRHGWRRFGSFRERKAATDHREYLSDTTFEEPSETRPKRRSILDRIPAIRSISRNTSPEPSKSESFTQTSQSAKNVHLSGGRMTKQRRSSPNIGTASVPRRHLRTQTAHSPTQPRSMGPQSRRPPHQRRTMTSGSFRPPVQREQLSFFDALNDDLVEPDDDEDDEAEDDHERWKPRSMRPPRGPARSRNGLSHATTRRSVDRSAANARRAHSASARSPRMANRAAAASDNDAASISISSLASADCSPRATRRGCMTPSTRDAAGRKHAHAGPPYAESTSASELPKPRTGSLSSHRAPRTSVSVSVGGSHRATPRTSIDTRQPLPPQRLAPAADSAPSSSSPSTSGSGTNSSGKKATRSSPAAPTTPVHNERRRRGRSMDAKVPDNGQTVPVPSGESSNGAGVKQNLQLRRPPAATKFANSKPSPRNATMDFMEAIELSSHSSDEFIGNDTSFARRRLPFATEFEKDIEVAQGRLRVLFQYLRDSPEGDSSGDLLDAARRTSTKDFPQYPMLDEPTKMAISRLRRELKQAQPSNRITYAMRKRARDCIDSLDSTDTSIKMRFQRQAS